MTCLEHTLNCLGQDAFSLIPCCCLLSLFAKVTRPEVVSNLTPEEAEEAKKIKADGVAVEPVMSS